MRRRRKREQKAPEIMLSPMIDMIFLLLVFFIVSTMYMSEVKSIPIRLPVARHAENVSKSNFNVTVKQDGTIYLDENETDIDMLVNNAAVESKRDSSFSVIIRAEDDAPYKTVIQIMDRLKGAGVTRFGLATDAGGSK